MTYTDDTMGLPDRQMVAPGPEMVPDMMQPEPGPLDFIQEVIASPNIAPEGEDDTLRDIAAQVNEDYNSDKDSMTEWLTMMQRGIEFAQMVKDDKTYPHAKAANIKYPLITTAALHYNARTYPAIVPSSNPVRCKVNGSDPTGQKAAMAERTADYASHQLQHDIEGWEEDMDRLTFIGPIVGTMLKKVWYDPSIDGIRSKLCKPGTVIINHNITSLSQAPAITEELALYQHEIATRIRTGMWSDVEEDLQLDSDRRSEEVEFIEQHIRFDLDDDGYAEPYVVTMHVGTETIVRMVANFTLEDAMLDETGSKILAIKPQTYFVDYTFLPAFDGGFWGSGFGMLLGDISESINSTLNMLMDAGHYQSMPTGFIAGQDLRLSQHMKRFEPGEWRHVNARGNDIRSALVPFTMPSPSPVLFQMLGLLIDMGREIGSSKDIPAESAAQMTATTTMALIDQGMQVFNASYKRIYRSLTREFKMMYRINQENLTSEKYNEFFDDVDANGMPMKYDPAIEFSTTGMSVTPVADSKSVTDAQKMGRAQFLIELSQMGAVDQAAAITRVLEAAHIENIEELIPQPSPQDAIMADMQMMNMKLDLRMKAAEIDAKMAKAVKDLASAESEEVGRNLQEYMNSLQAMKSEIELGQQRLGAMAQQPGNAAAPAPDAAFFFCQ